MFDLSTAPWPWYVAGTLIGAEHSIYVVPLCAALAGTYLYGLAGNDCPIDGAVTNDG